MPIKQYLMTTSNVPPPPAEGYTRLEYIESTGTQYIDTGVLASTGTKVEFEAMYTRAPTETEAWIIAAFTNAGGGATSQGFRGGLVSGSFNTAKGFTYSTNNPYDKFIGKGTAVDSPTATLYLFAQNERTTTYQKPIWFASARLYYCKIWDPDGTLIRDFIPCLDPDGIPCLYDTVSQSAFYHTGSGSLAYGFFTSLARRYLMNVSFSGPLPAGYTKVNYLEATGTQYINTKVLKTVGLSGKVVYSFKVSVSDTMWAFGARDDNNDSFDGFIWQNIVGITRHALTAEANVLLAEGQTITDDTILTAIITPNELSLSTNTGINLHKNMNITLYPSALTIYLGALKRNGPMHYLRGKIYLAKFYDTDLVGYFIPCLDPNGRPCMYDMVTKQPFYNNGTGEFLYG